MQTWMSICMLWWLPLNCPILAFLSASSVFSFCSSLASTASTHTK